MADIVLKDKVGNTSDFTGVNVIRVTDNNGNKIRFTNMNCLKVYLATYDENTKLYTINSEYFHVKSDNYFITGFHETTEPTMFVITRKTLTIGSSYTESDLGVE